MKRCAPILFLLLTTQALAAPPTAEAELARLQKYCYGRDVSMSEGRDCMAKKAQQLRRDLESSVRKQLFEIDEIEKRSPEDGGLNGKEAAARYRAAFRAEQDAWASYEKSRCSNVGEFENYGGSGAGGAVSACSIRLILRRIAELRDGD